MRRFTTSPLLRFSLIAVAAAVAPIARGDDHRLTIQAPAGAAEETPIVVATPPNFAPGLYTLRAASGTPSLEAVAFSQGEQVVLGFIAPELGEATDFLVSPSTRAPRAEEGVTFTSDGPNLKIAVDGAPLTVHHVDGEYKPFLFPLINPAGRPMTRSYPMQKVEGDDVDHPHHQSFWFTHGKVNGVDFWDVKKGIIRETAREIETSGPVVGRLVTHDDWIAPDGAKVCEDERRLTVYQTRKARIFDLEVTIKATEGPLLFGETKEGSFGIRVASSMDVDKKKGGVIRNAEGLIDAAAWGKPSAWVDYTGPVADGTAGITVFNHPTSFRHPTTWHVRTYGLFAANPFGGPDFKVPGYAEHRVAAGDSVRFAYRVVLHEGVADPSEIARAYALYATPVKALWGPTN